MSIQDFTTEYPSLLGSSESLESLQEPDWLKDATHPVASSEGAPLTNRAASRLQRSEETLELMRKANEKLAAERHAAALAALAVAEQHAEECARTQAVVAAARAQGQRAQVTATAAAAWSRLSSEAARSVAQAEVERVHAALAVHAALWHAPTTLPLGHRRCWPGRRQAERMRRSCAQAGRRASRMRRRAREEGRRRAAVAPRGDPGGGGGGGGYGAAPAFSTAVATLRHGPARR